MTSSPDSPESTGSTDSVEIPGARRSPTPRPNPGQLAKNRGTARVVSQQKEDPAQWGRIAEDGTVYRRSADGTERAIAQWQAGIAEEGLKHFSIRYKDFSTEVDMLRARLAKHPEEADSIKDTAEGLLLALPDAPIIGDVDKLDATLRTIISSHDAAVRSAEETQRNQRERAIARKQRIITEAEKLARTDSDWSYAGNRFHALVDEWRSIRGADKQTDDELWNQFSHARSTFNKRRGSHFADLDRQRAKARRIKEQLVEQAEAIQNSTDWSETARTYGDLMNQWRAAGRAPKNVDDQLWEKFRAAQDHFFGARDAHNAKVDREYEANADKKAELIDSYSQRIDPEKDPRQARQLLAELQERCDDIGFVSRGRKREIENQLSNLQKRIDEVENRQWRRSDPEAQARAAQFLDKVAELNAQADQAEKAENTEKAAHLKEQAAQWQQWADTAQQAVDNR